MAQKKETAQKAGYGNESIVALKGADRVRKRPGVIFGSDGLDGCEHAFFEILSNSVDEAREGYGSVIDVTRYLDKSIRVEDHGRGVPVDWNPNEKKYNWELVYCELYAGGKYNTLDGEGYEYSLGLNGLGSCATQYSSEFMDVESRRDGFLYTLHFKKGKNAVKTKEGMIKEETTKKGTGTTHHWRPDIEVFTDIDIPLEYYRETLRRQAAANAGLRFVLHNETEKGRFETEEFYYEKGIETYVALAAGDDAITGVRYIEGERRGRDREDKPEYKVRLSAAFCFTKSTPFLEYMHNSSWLEHGGAPDKAVRSAFVSAFDQYLRQSGKYTKNEAKITFPDVADCLALVTNTFSTNTSYENQTKKAITNRFIQEAMTAFFKSELEIYFIENKAEADRACDQVLLNKRSRETAERTRLNIKKKLTGEMGIADRVEKFVDCRSKDPDRRELYIVEGDSALGACKQGRDSDFQAIIPVRGKIFNCMKAEYERIFKSEIITDLIKVVGCGVEVKTKAKEIVSFDLNLLRWNKIVICTDADVDGYHIRTLILAMFYRLMPTLIEKGYIYIAESPLYEIVVRGKKEDENLFAYNETEKTQILEKLEGKRYTIQRSKGLGENEPEMMWQTTMNPETRRLIRVMPEDVGATLEAFDLFLGDNLIGRRDYITENGSRFIDLADIS
ncbi:MAG: DNA topoisomerase [Clostridia bacterium]|nr:DNA topoisomerase [Clostridia bacterium]